MSSNRESGGNPGPRSCLNCYTTLKREADSSRYPGGAWVTTKGQGMRNADQCPSLPLMMGYPQAHVPGADGWTPPDSDPPKRFGPLHQMFPAQWPR